MINKVILVGKLQDDATSKQTTNNQQMTRFTVRTSEAFKKNGETVYDNQYHNCKLFGDWVIKANLLERLVKGTEVYVEGKLSTYTYEDPKTNTTKHLVEIIVETLRLL